MSVNNKFTNDRINKVLSNIPQLKPDNIESMSLAAIETLIEYLTNIKNLKISNMVSMVDTNVSSTKPGLFNPMQLSNPQDWRNFGDQCMRNSRFGDNMYTDPNSFNVNTRTGNKTYTNPYEYSNPKEPKKQPILTPYIGPYFVDKSVSPYNQPTVTDANYRDSIIESSMRPCMSGHSAGKKCLSQQEIDRFESDKLDLQSDNNIGWKNMLTTVPNTVTSRQENIRYV